MLIHAGEAISRAFPTTASALRAAAIGLVAALLAGCGGGGGGEGGHDLTVSFSYGATTSTQVLGPSGSVPTISGLEGNAPHCSLQSGTLPPGLSVQTDCTISGIVTQSGNYDASIQLTAANYSGSVSAQLDYVVPDLTLVPAIGSAGQLLPIGVAMSNFTIFAVQGYTPAPGDVLHYTLVSGSLPAGVTFDEATGTLSGTPDTLVDTQITVHMTLARGNLAATTADVTLPIAVAESALTVTYGTCCTASIGVPFSASPITSFVSATNASISYALGTGVTLPPGLVLDPATGVISGTPSDFIPSITPNTVQVLATATLPSGTQSATSMYFQIAETGVYPFYPVSSLGAATNYSPAADPEVLSVTTTPGATITWAPGTIHGSLPGDTYRFAITTSPVTNGLPTPGWVSVDPATGVVTAAVPVTGAAGARFGLEVTVIRNGVAYTQSQGWLVN